MVDYDAAVAAVQDPNADPILLAKNTPTENTGTLRLAN